MNTNEIKHSRCHKEEIVAPGTTALLNCEAMRQHLPQVLPGALGPFPEPRAMAPRSAPFADTHTYNSVLLGGHTLLSLGHTVIAQGTRAARSSIATQVPEETHFCCVHKLKPRIMHSS